MKKIHPKELAAADEIYWRTGMSCSMPGDGIEASGLKWQWGVYVGSHGGHGKTLVKAMRACLQCCGLGAWWRVSPPEDNELLRDFFADVICRYDLLKLK